MQTKWIHLFGSSFFLAATLVANAQLSQVASVLNGFGGRATGGTYTQIAAGAQPGGIGVSYEGGSANYAGGMINRAGFLNTFVLRPDIDTNGNGLADELDPDNDADGLWDHWEISGEKFLPNTPTHPNLIDSDGNGTSDFDEMIAGTNPNDPASAFVIVNIEADPGTQEITWQARGNNERIYVVRAIDESYDDTPATVIWSNTVAGGNAPWYDTDATVTDVSGNSRFYAIEVIKP